MSLSWNESVRVALSPERAALVRLSRGKPQLLESLPADGDADNPPWASALSAFAEGLTTCERGAAVTVVLSNHFVRYVLVPWNDALAGEDEALAHARHCFSRIHGAAADAWDIRISPEPGGQQVASAVDRELLAGLDRAVASTGRRLASVQPYLMAAFNRWRREFADPLTWFVLAERGRLCLAALQHGRWVHLVNVQAGADWPAELPDLLARQRMLCGLDEVPGKVCICAPEATAEQALRQAGETVRALHPAPPVGVAAEEAVFFEMALNG